MMLKTAILISCMAFLNVEYITYFIFVFFLLYTIIIKEVIFARKKKIFTVCYNCNTLQASSPYLICAL